MSATNNGMSCQTGCWALAAGVGFITFVMLLVAGSNGWIASIFLGGVAFVLLGFLFSWMFCAPLTKPGEAASELKAPGSAGVTPGSAGKAPGSAGAEPAPAPAAAAAPNVNTATAAGDAEAGASVKPSKPLAGEKELSERKGEWKYGSEGGSTAMAAGAAAGADKEAATTSSLDPDAPQEKPQTLDGPRDGGADNLKEIKGVGPKLEQLLNEMGFYHFDQIAAWNEKEVNWVNQNLSGFKGRVTRDDWVAQAKVLASGGETEFSKRVDKGDVY